MLSTSSVLDHLLGYKTVKTDEQIRHLLQEDWVCSHRMMVLSCPHLSSRHPRSGIAWIRARLSVRRSIFVEFIRLSQTECHYWKGWRGSCKLVHQRVTTVTSKIGCIDHRHRILPKCERQVLEMRGYRKGSCLSSFFSNPESWICSLFLIMFSKSDVAKVNVQMMLRTVKAHILYFITFIF